MIGSRLGSFSRLQNIETEDDYDSIEDVNAAFCRILDSMEPSVPITLDLLHERSDGVMVPVELRCVRTSHDKTGYILGIARDLTDRHRSEAALRESEQRYRTLFETASDLVLGFDSNEHLLFMNPEWLKRLGLQEHECHDYSIGDFISAESLGTVRLLLSSAKVSGEFQPLEMVLKTQDGCTVVVEGAVVCEVHSKDIGVYRGIFRDVTQQREVDRIKDDLISTVSHELRTPLTSLRGYSELLLDRDMSNKQVKEYVQIIHQETLRLNRLINDLLDIRKLETDGQDYSLELMDLREILSDVVRLFAEVEPTSRVAFDWENPLPTIGDADRLKQVFTNLLSNAIKVSSSDSPIVVAAKISDGRVIISVTDFGIGIPEHAMSRLFKKFSRVDSPKHQHIKGTGLGLALAHEIVTAHRGEIWVESRYGQGTTFFVSLPVGSSGAT